MGDQVSVIFDFSGVERMIANGEKTAIGATASALNKAAGKLVTQATRQIARESGVQPQRLIRRRMRIRRATFSRLQAAVTFLLRPIPAIQLTGAGRAKTGLGKKNTGGISIMGKGGLYWPTGFIAMGRGGHWQIFRRKPGARHKKVTGRGGTSGRSGFLGIGRQKATGQEWHALPIEAMKIDIRTIAENVLRARAGDAVAWVKEILPGELVWRMTGGRQGKSAGLS